MTTTTTSSFGTASAVEDTGPAAADGLLRRGDVLGRYEILFPIATGGMASVYAARLLGEGMFQRPVAIKVMLPHLARDERFVAMFIDEAALAARVESPHVVQVIELGRHAEHTLFIAMDLVVGVSLRQVFERSEGKAVGLPLPVLGTILIQAATGLNDAHEARAPNGERLGIVHRDISPHNVLVGSDGRARITDFGIARAFERVSATQTGELKGKLPYFSPEQVRCVELDARSDVFSLGIVAWELLAAQRLFDAPNPLAIAQAVAAKPIPRLDTLGRDIPRGVADLVASALERDPERRLSSAEAFARGLREACAASCGLADAREVGSALRALCGDNIVAIETSLSEAMSMRTAGHKVIAPAPDKRRLFGVVALSFALLSLVTFGAWSLRGPSAPERSLKTSDVRSAPQPQPRLDVTPPEPAPSSAAAGSAEGKDSTVPEAPTEVLPAEPVPVESTPKARSRPSRRRVRRSVSSPEPSDPSGTPSRDSLLRKLEDFDRERTR